MGRIIGGVLLGVILTSLTFAAAPVYQIHVAWDVPDVPSQIEDNWKLYRKVQGGTYTVLALLDPTVFEYTDQAVHKHTLYFYVITAVRGVEESPFSNEVSSIGTRVQ